MVVCAAALVAACGDGSTALAPQPTPSGAVIHWSPRSASPTPSPAPTQVPRPCTSDEVGSSFGGWGAAAGSIGGTFQLYPTSQPGCALPAHPAIRLVGVDDTTILAEPSAVSRATWVPLVDGAGKRSTFVSIQWSNHGGDQGYACSRRSAPAVALQIEMPSWRIELPFPSGSRPTFCADPRERVFVSVNAPDPLQPPPPPPAFSARIDAPQTARAGERLRYIVELTNATDVDQRFAECPAYVHNIAGPHELGSGDRPGFIAPERRHLLNCGGIGAIAPGATLSFEMIYDIPRDAFAGTYVLAFRLDGPAYSTGVKTLFAMSR